MSTNQYQAPRSNVEQAEATDYADVRVWSAQGRMGRLRYFNYYAVIPTLIFFVFYMIFGIAAAIMIPIFSQTGDGSGMSAVGFGFGAFIMIFMLAYLVYSFLLTIQRCHDFDASGWLSLLMLVPGVSFIFFLLLLFLPGTSGANRYGQQTKPNTTGHVVIAVIGPFLFVVIIGILAAVAIPAYQSYIERAQQSQQFDR